MFVINEDYNVNKLLKKIELYEFINTLTDKNFNNMIDEMKAVEVPFFTDNYQEFMKFQIKEINNLSNDDLNYHLNMKELIEDGSISVMDKEDMNENPANVFYFMLDEDNKMKTVISHME